MEIKKWLAKSISYEPFTRNLTDVIAIVFHWTAVNGDTAFNEAKYFATGNTRRAGAHVFVDQQGQVYQSVEFDRVAIACGGNYNTPGGKSLKGKVTNRNSVSVEMCDIVNKEPSDAMVSAIRELIKEIQKQCPNAKIICRHFDTAGKDCPRPFIDNKKWEEFKKKILSDGYGEYLPDEKFELIKDSYLRLTPEVKQNKVAYNNLSSTLKKHCRNNDGYAVLKSGTVFTRIRSFKDEKDNKFMELKSGYWIPVFWDNQRRIKNL